MPHSLSNFLLAKCNLVLSDENIKISGTENVSQRFDGRKLIRFRNDGLENSMPLYGVDQIPDTDEGKMWVRQGNLIGIFDRIIFSYHKVRIQLNNTIPARTEMQFYRDSKENIFYASGNMAYGFTTRQKMLLLKMISR